MSMRTDFKGIEKNLGILLQQNKALLSQNEVMISLLARQAFTGERIREIVEANKRENLKTEIHRWI